MKNGKELKEELGYALFPGDYVVELVAEENRSGREYFAQNYLITELMVNDITVARLKTHYEERRDGRYTEDVLIYDDEIEVINPIKHSSKYTITYRVYNKDTSYRNKDYPVTGENLFPYEYLMELGDQITKEGTKFDDYHKEISDTKYKLEKA